MSLSFFFGIPWYAWLAVLSVLTSWFLAYVLCQSIRKGDELAAGMRGEDACSGCCCESCRGALHVPEEVW